MPPVKVHYFPKPARSGRSGAPSLADTQEHRVTLPEMDALDLPTDEAPSPVVEREPAPAAEGSRRKRPVRGSKRKRGATPVASDLQPTVRTTAIPEHPPAATNGAQLTAEQLAEISVFGHHLFETGQLSEARVIFEGIVGMGVEDAFPHTMLGTIYLAQGDPDHALALFEAALALDQADLAARVYRGEIRLGAGNVGAGLDDLRQALQIGNLSDPFVQRAQRLIRAQQERARPQRR